MPSPSLAPPCAKGLDSLPVAELAGVPSSTCGCWSITASAWFAMRTALYGDVLWHLHDSLARARVAR